MTRLLFAALALAGGVCLVTTARAQAPVVDLDALLARVGLQLETHFDRTQSIIVTEVVSTRSFDRMMQLSGLPRRYEYERRIEWGVADANGLPRVVVRRQLLSVNGRRAGPEDGNLCLAPQSEDDDPLSILLPARQREFAIALDEVDVVDGRQVARLTLTPREVSEGTVEFDGDCIRMELDGWYGRDVWVDVASGDVLRLDEQLLRRFEFREPADRPFASLRWVVLERDNTSIRYESVAFEDPAETLMLPRSIERSWASEGAGVVPRYFRSQRFENYRRFLTGGRLVGAPEPGSPGAPD
jgi:hypothetical protein